MTPKEEIDLWYSEQVALNGVPCTDEDHQKMAGAILAAHEISPALLRHMIASEKARRDDRARGWSN